MLEVISFSKCLECWAAALARDAGAGGKPSGQAFAGAFGSGKYSIWVTYGLVENGAWGRVGR